MTKKTTKKLNKIIKEAEPVIKTEEVVISVPASPKQFVFGDVIRNMKNGKVLTYHHQASVDENIEDYELTGIRI